MDFAGAVTGGTFIPNNVWPEVYDGTFLFADFVFKRMYHILPAPGCRTCEPPVPEFTNTTFHDTERRVVEMFFGPYGENGEQAMYYVLWGEGSAIRRIR